MLEFRHNTDADPPSPWWVDIPEFVRNGSRAREMGWNCSTVESERMKKAEDLWRAAPVRPDFPSDHIAVWRIRLNAGEAEGGKSVLSLDETARAEGFRFARDRLHFVQCRTAVRKILGQYLAIPPQEICFRYGANGKPEIVEHQNPRGLKFNISHSSDLALLAVVAGHAIGIDVEKIRPEVECLRLAQRFFSEKEYQDLLRLPASDREWAFFACWTRKEAFIKACGEGLAFPLSQFSVSFSPNVPARLEELRTDPSAAPRWAFINLEPEPGYVGALVVNSPAQPLELWRFDELEARSRER